MDLPGLYQRLRATSRITTSWREVEPGDAYVGFRLKQPSSGPRRWLWELWRTFEARPPTFKDLAVRLARRTPWQYEFDFLNQTELDGNSFVEHALARGACLIITDRVSGSNDPRVVVVADVATTLRALAKHHRTQLKMPIVAVTGTVGKSTTTKLIADILRSQYKVYESRQFNGLPRLPVALLNAPLDADVLVIELATVRPGMLSQSCALIQPTHGLITRTGKAHLESLPDLNAVQMAKWELLEYVEKHNGKTFLNMNRDWLAAQRDRLSQPWTLGDDPNCRTHTQFISADPELVLDWFPTAGERIRIRTRLAGSYNYDNVVAAIAVATQIGVDPQAIVRDIERFQAPENRSEIFTWGSNRVFNDTSHTNPCAAEAALRSLSEMQADKKIAVLADMEQLGPANAGEHQAIAQFAAEQGFADLWFVGPSFYRCRSKVRGRYFRSPRTFERWLIKNRPEQALILVKGSPRYGLLKMFVRD
jgi:UDP-N-acetylmuramoyl-tripeptide--D-alanyl-D-alanine ligase